MKRIATTLTDTIDAENERSCQLDNDAEYALADAGYRDGDHVVILPAAELAELDKLEALARHVAGKTDGPDDLDAIEICDVIRALDSIRTGTRPTGKDE